MNSSVLIFGVILVLALLIYLAMVKKSKAAKPLDNLSALDEIAPLEQKISFVGGGATIREVNQRLHGVDVRQLWKDGYSDKQIRGLLLEEYDILELYKMEPEGNSHSPTGKELLTKKRASGKR